MKGKYIPFNDGFGIVGYGYECPECEHHSLFTDCEEGCKKCGFKEPYKDPDDWFDEFLKEVKK
jgi:uncharacterized protein (DUF983 family)